MVTLVTGPSRTADIERVLTVGVQGPGRVMILFADDPLFRHFWYATFQPFVNAVLLGPAM